MHIALGWVPGWRISSKGMHWKHARRLCAGQMEEYLGTAGVYLHVDDPDDGVEEHSDEDELPEGLVWREAEVEE
jgi:hypothetical protein